MNFKYFQVISMLMILCGCSENRLERQVPSSLSSINQEKISSNVFPRQISAHGDSVCMLKDDQINCWGSMANFNSEIPLITNIKQISTSNEFACALANDSVTWWGTELYNISKVPYLKHSIQISAGRDFACALSDDGVFG